jgi:TonB family protein
MATWLNQLVVAATIIAASTPTSSLATEPPILTGAQAKRLAVFAPKPEYPEAARKQHLMGKGIFLLNLNAQTGQVKSIKIEKGTGSRILDAACLKALINWRFKPTSNTKVRVPVMFVIGGLRKTELDAQMP